MALKDSSVNKDAYTTMTTYVAVFTKRRMSANVCQSIHLYHWGTVTTVIL